MPLESVVGAVIVLALVIYLVTGGADFGSGIWELASWGPRAQARQEALRDAIAPVWEAHHVWLIVAVVLLFVCFPPAFAHVMIALHVPLTLLLVGIVLRGSAFVFRSYAAGDRALEVACARVFVIASITTPVMLGLIAGALASGQLHTVVSTSSVPPSFFAGWTGAFPFAIGGFTLALCAYLAAVYMTTEVDDPALQEDFRARGLGAAVAVGAGALVALVTAQDGAPALHEGLVSSSWSLPFHALTGGAALGAAGALWARRWRTCQALAIVQTAGIVIGWALAQSPYLIRPDHTLASSAAPPAVLRASLWVLGLGALAVLPALATMYLLFKRGGGKRGQESKQ